MTQVTEEPISDKQLDLWEQDAIYAHSFTWTYQATDNLPMPEFAVLVMATPRMVVEIRRLRAENERLQRDNARMRGTAKGILAGIGDRPNEFLWPLVRRDLNRLVNETSYIQPIEQKG